MAVQMHVAYSSLINGSAVYAGGPFYCAMDNLMIAEQYCMYDFMSGPKTEELIQYTNKQASLGTIDDVSNLKGDKVYMFSGKKDTTVNPKTMHALEDYYNAFGVTDIDSEFDIKAAHCLPTVDYGEKCDLAVSPYIGKCDYDGAGLAMQKLYGPGLKEGSVVKSNFMEFNQKPFYTGTGTSLDTSGYIYIPTACQDGSVACKLHMNFHGCKQAKIYIQDQYAADTGFNSWAEANNIIVVYPYVVRDLDVGNGNACFDWWGYTGDDYSLKSGVQMAFAKSIIDTLMGA